MIARKTLKVADPYCCFGLVSAEPDLPKGGSFFWMDRRNGNDFFSYISYRDNGTYRDRCREVIATWRRDYRNTFNRKLIGFAVNPLHLTKVNEFFDYVEERLNLRHKTLIYKTTHENAIIFAPSPFWLKNNFNFEILTLFIRCACVFYYGERTILDALRIYPLTNTILKVINRFLCGYTEFTGWLAPSGICSTFKELMGMYNAEFDNQLKELLKKPTENNKDFYVV